jgi:hypothetical protein
VIFLFANYIVVTQAALIPFTYDEAYSYLHYARSWHGFADVSIANNHYLNSFLMRLSSFFLGSEPFVLRLPNVLSFYIYSAVAYWVSRKLEMAAFSFAALVANAYLLDFFSLSRGYGIASASGLFAFAVLYRSASPGFAGVPNRVMAARWISFVALAVSAAAFPPMAIPLIAATTIYIVRDSREQVLSPGKLLCYASLGAAAVISAWLLHSVNQPGLPPVYATRDIWMALASPLQSYAPDANHPGIIAAIFLSVVAGTSVAVVYLGLTSRANLEALGTSLLILMGAVFIPASIGWPLPFKRTFLPFVPVLILSLLICWSAIWRRLHVAGSRAVPVSLLLSVLVVVLCAYNSSVTEAFDWREDTDIERLTLKAVTLDHCAPKWLREDAAFKYYVQYHSLKMPFELPDCR